MMEREGERKERTRKEKKRKGRCFIVQIEHTNRISETCRQPLTSKILVCFLMIFLSPWQVLQRPGLLSRKPQSKRVRQLFRPHSPCAGLIWILEASVGYACISLRFSWGLNPLDQCSQTPTSLLLIVTFWRASILSVTNCHCNSCNYEWI